MQAAPKIKILMWKIFQNALPTFHNLFRRKLLDSPLCPICETEPETTEHVFLFCPWTQPVWFGSGLQWVSDFSSVQKFEIWLCQKLEEINRVHPNANKVTAIVGNIFWAIWKGRNKFVFEHQPVNPLGALINLVGQDYA